MTKHYSTWLNVWEAGLCDFGPIATHWNGATSQLHLTYSSGAIVASVFGDVLAGSWIPNDAAHTGGTLAWQLTSAGYRGVWHRPNNSAGVSQSGPWNAPSGAGPLHGTTAHAAVWAGRYETSFGLVELNVNERSGALTGHFADGGRLVASICGAAAGGVWQTATHHGTFVWRKTYWGFEGWRSDTDQEPGREWIGKDLNAAVLHPYARVPNQKWLCGDPHVHVSGRYGKQVEISNAAVLRKACGTRRAVGDAPLFDFIGALSHDDHAPGNATLPAWPGTELPDDLFEGLTVLRGIEQQYNADEVPRLDVSAHSRAYLGERFIHLCYLEIVERGAIAVHPNYDWSLSPGDSGYEKIGYQGLSDLCTSSANRTLTNAPLVRGVELYNDFAFMRGPSIGETGELWRNTFGEQSDPRLIPLVYAGSCAFFFTSPKAVPAERAKHYQETAQGRLAKGWLHVLVSDFNNFYRSTKECILAALDAGRFFSSTGVEFTEIAVVDQTIHISAASECTWLVGGNRDTACVETHHPTRQFEYPMTESDTWVQIQARDAATPRLTPAARQRMLDPYRLAWTQPFWNPARMSMRKH